MQLFCRRCPPQVREEIHSFMVNKSNASKMVEGNFLNIIEVDAFGGGEKDKNERNIMISSQSYQGSKVLNTKK